MAYQRSSTEQGFLQAQSSEHQQLKYSVHGTLKKLGGTTEISKSSFHSNYPKQLSFLSLEQSKQKTTHHVFNG